MPKNPIIPTLGLLLAIVGWASAGAQDPAMPKADVIPAKPAVDAAPLTEAEKTVDAAIAKLKALKSVEAEIQVSADMLNQKFRLDGSYKKAPGNRVLLLLSLVGSADASDRMLQVCDGQTMWDFIKVLDSQRCTKRSIDKILKVLSSPDCDPQLREEVINGLGFSGPEAVLAGLRKSFVIDQTREGELNGKPVWILGGSWKDSKTPVSPGSMGGNPAVLPSALPPYVPGLVYIYLGKEDFFPYQVIFEGRMPAQIEKKKPKIEESQVDAVGRAISKKLTAPATKPSKLVLIYSKVKINQAIPDETFAFTPPANVTTQDETDLVVSQLTKVIEDQAEKRKAQSTKAGPVLEGGVAAPAPNAESPLKPPLESPPGVPK